MLLPRLGPLGLLARIQIHLGQRRGTPCPHARIEFSRVGEDGLHFLGVPGIEYAIQLLQLLNRSHQRRRRRKRRQMIRQRLLLLLLVFKLVLLLALQERAHSVEVTRVVCHG